MRIRENMRQLLEERLAQLHTLGAGTIGDMLQLRLLACDVARGEFLMGCRTEVWMRNIAGTLHGGLCATLVDQAMGCVAYCAKPGEGTAPTIDLQVSYLRPLIPGEEAVILVRVTSVSKNLIHLSAEAALASDPDKPCLTSSATYFYKPAAGQ